MDINGYSPMMRHYLSVKEQYPDAILFYRLGDFYEMFFEDARIVSENLNLVLTAKAAGKEKVAMCGVPFHSAESYIERLINLGYKVAICEQVSDPKEKGLVDREVVQVLTPGTYISERDGKKDNYLGVLISDDIHNMLLLCDVSNGEILYEEGDLNPDWVIRLLLEYEVQEVVIPKGISAQIKKELKKTFLVSENEINVSDSSVTGALEVLKDYLERTQFKVSYHLQKPKKLENPVFMQIDYETKKHLELIHTFSRAKNAKSLWASLDVCKGSMGSRKLKKWIEFPLQQPSLIIQRQQVIEDLIENFITLDEIRELLGGITDLERLVSKISYQTITIPELFRLIRSLKGAARLFPELEKISKTEVMKQMENCAQLLNKLDALMEESEESWIRKGVFTDYDDLLRLKNESGAEVEKLERELNEQFGIPLRIVKQRTFGYLIEIKNSVLKEENRLSLIEEKFGLKPRQTLTSATRFVYEPLRKLQEEIETAQEKIDQFEKEVLGEIRGELIEWIEPLRKLADGISEIDVLAALAKKAQEGNWIRPDFNNNGKVEIHSGRHPILNERMDDFVPNDWFMGNGIQVQCVTGPNMGGKSTFLRQNGLLVIMAQIGSFIPADSADLPIFDRIFTRIGASDDLLLGQSTFMTEMVETNRALRNATPNSLILLDEIGRGTSTYDGMALSRAIIEYILDIVHSKTIFSTHYHELTDIEDSAFENLNALVSEEKGSISFRYRIVSGKANRSYGIQVAKLADLPQWVIARSRNLLKELETQNHEVTSLFVMEQNPYLDMIVSKIRNLDLDNVTPRQALNLLVDVKEKISEIDQKENF